MTVAELTGDQQAAVAGRGTTFVSAGAGTGKTTVLVERVAQAVEGGLEPGADPGRDLHRARRAAADVARPRPARGGRATSSAGSPSGSRSRRSTASAPGSCASTPSPPGSTPSSGCSRRPAPRILAAEAFERALRAAVDAEPDEALDLLAAYGGDKLRGMLGARCTASCARPACRWRPSCRRRPSLERRMQAAREGCELVERHYLGDDSDPPGGPATPSTALRALLDAPPEDPSSWSTCRT